MRNESWTDDRVYQDPTGISGGRAALVAHIGGFHAMFPGRSIDQASGVDVTEARLRWTWVMCNDNAIELEGLGFAELAPRRSHPSGLSGSSVTTWHANTHVCVGSEMDKRNAAIMDMTALPQGRMAADRGRDK